MAQIRLDKDEADGGLPHVCMKCGQPAAVTKIRNMSWYPQWVIILILVNIIVFAVVALILTKRARVQVPLCEQHKGHWFNRNLVIWLLFFLFGGIGIGSLVLVSNLQRGPRDDLFPFVCIGCFVLLVAWLIVVIVAQSTAIRPAEITDTEIVLNGVSQEFVDAVSEADHEGYSRGRSKAKNWEDDDVEDEAPRNKRPPSEAIEEE